MSERWPTELEELEAELRRAEAELEAYQAALERVRPYLEGTDRTLADIVEVDGLLPAPGPSREAQA